MKEQVFKKILLQGTLLVKKVALKEIDIEAFLEQYNNFYYYNALDGHEANAWTSSLLNKYSKLISLHKEIQFGVVDLVYHGDANSSLSQTYPGRISVDDAMQSLKIILENYDIDALTSEVED